MAMCDDCSKTTTRPPFCEACFAKSFCSNCHVREIPFNPLKTSLADKKTLCTSCFNHQCCYCGCFSEEEDPTDEEFCWVEGFLYCEECARHYICNQCGGSCNYPCPSCDAAHDCECECEIECLQCEKLFIYNGNDMWDRYHSKLWNQKLREICEDCWGKIEQKKELINCS